MKKSVKNLLTIFLVFVLTASYASVAYSQESSEKAKQILENTYKKYSDLARKEGEGLKSVAAKVSIKGGTQVPMGGSGGSMPLDVDAIIELYVRRPHYLYVDISGNLGNVKIAVAGKEKVTAMIMLPSTKQFAAIDVPEEVIQKMQKRMQEDDPQEPDKMEELWKEVILTYEGTQSTEAGKAHKIAIKPKDPSEKSSLTAYILDDKWDPARFEINEPEEGGKLVIEFEKLELNIDIPDERFVPDTKGYTQVSEKDLATVIMMQVMSTMMGQSQEE
jgi:outer membrane lipoprotein-sorting protein